MKDGSNFGTTTAGAFRPPTPQDPSPQSHLHKDPDRTQLWRTYRNLTQLLGSEGATWHDVVRCTCYLRDIERDYTDFNAIRTEFFAALALDPLPASTAIQARLCRSDLLVEIEAHAILDVSSSRAR